MSTEPKQNSRRGNAWKILLLVPFLGLCFPQLYSRATPALFGFPFFYWYQFAWVFVAAGVMALVYRKTKR